MFSIDQKVTLEDIRGKNLVKAFFSMNNHQVATPEMMLEDARSYIMFFRESGGKLSAYIGLQLLATGRKLFYSHSSNPFSQDETASIEDEALVFVEGLGALLDEKDFTQLTAEEKNQWMDNQEIFIEKAVQESSEEERPAEEKHEEPAPVQQEPRVSQSPSLMSVFPVSPEPPQPTVQYQPQPSQPPVPPIQFQPPQQPPVPPIQYQPPQPPPVPPGQYAPPQSAPVPPVQYQPQPSQPPVPPMQYQPPQQPPVPPVQYTPPPQPAAPSSFSQQAQQAPSVQPTFEAQKEQVIQPQRQNNGVLQKHAKPLSGQAAALPETEETVEKPVHSLPKSRQEIMQKAIKAGVVKAPKQQHKESPAVNGVVSRDREALARLLTSF